MTRQSKTAKSLAHWDTSAPSRSSHQTTPSSTRDIPRNRSWDTEAYQYVRDAKRNGISDDAIQTDLAARGYNLLALAQVDHCPQVKPLSNFLNDLEALKALRNAYFDFPYDYDDIMGELVPYGYVIDDDMVVRRLIHGESLGFDGTGCRVLRERIERLEAGGSSSDLSSKGSSQRS